MLDYFFAPFVLEIDVDVGRLVPLRRNESLEQRVDGVGSDIGDAETITDHRIRRRPAALTQDRLRQGPGVLHDVMNGEEERRIAKLADDFQLLIENLSDVEFDAVRKTPLHAGFGKCDQPLLRGVVVSAGFVRIIVLHLVEREMAALEKALRLRNGIGKIGKEPGHFLRRLQITFGIQGQQPAGLIEGYMLANAGDDILQHAAPGMMIENVIGGDQGNGIAGCDAGELRRAAPVVTAIEKPGCKPYRLFRGVLLQFGNQRRQLSIVDPFRRHHDQVESFDPIKQIRQMQNAVALFRFQLAGRKQPRQPSPGSAVGGINENVGRAVGKDQPCARDDTKAFDARFDMRAHHPRN